MTMELLERLREIHEADWKPVSTAVLAGGSVAVLIIIWLGNTGDKGSSLQLKDARGRTRMLLLVSADGKAKIEMLDEQGKVIKSIAPETES